MTRRSVENRLGKQEWTGGLRASFHDITVKAPAVDHPAIRNREDESDSLRVLRIYFYSRIRKRLQTSGRGKARDRTDAPQPRVRWQIGERRIGDTKNGVGLIAGLRCDFFGGRFLAVKQPLPHEIDAAAQRCNPPHPGDRDTHATARCINTEAFVPPNPKEFERTVCTAAARDSFATTSRSTSSSGTRKLMFGGRN